MTENQRAMLRALAEREWRRVDCTAGQARTLNTLVRDGFAGTRMVAGFGTYAITDAGWKALET